VLMRKFRKTRVVTAFASAIAPVLVVGSFGCASDTLAASEYARGPANPAAPESTLPSATPAASSSQGSSASELSPDAGVVYTCPMHPDVQMQAPGRCPKCGMNLVPKAP
jgi:hypothetical protein